jgi:glycosyltransferase involved in cell wall biosynthesis
MLTDKDLPLISCLLVTAKDRIDLFERSVRFFMQQTYPNKELVVVNEGPKSYHQEIRDALDGCGFEDRLKAIFLDGEYTLGALRNISILLCNGDYWVQWDDDDFNVPERLSIQYNFFSKHPDAKICYMSDQLHYYFNRKELYWDNWFKYHSGNQKRWGLIPGTGMARKEKIDVRYPSAGENACTGEDSVFSGQLLDQNEKDVVLLGGVGYMQCYTYHGKNVWDEEHHQKISDLRAMPADYMLQNESRIRKTIDHFNLEGPIKVMGREGEAFRVH